MFFFFFFYFRKSLTITKFKTAKILKNARCRRMAAELERECCIRGYHIYRAIWHAAVGETLLCAREPTNNSDMYAVAVIRAGVTIGHLPRRISLHISEKRRKYVLCSYWDKALFS